MIGLTTVDQGGALRIATRWPMLFAFVAACFAGRLLLRYGARPLAAAQARRASRPWRAAGARSLATSPLLTWIGWCCTRRLAACCRSSSRTTATWSIMSASSPDLRDAGLGLNIVVGLAGLLDLGYVAFYAVGAYSYALLATQLRLVLLDLPAARRHSGAAFWGVLLGFPVLRLRGDYLAIVTLALRRDHPPRADQLGRL